MSTTAFTGPLVSYGQRLPVGVAGPLNADLAPCVFWGGACLMDPRVGYNKTRRGTIGLYGDNLIHEISQVPSAISAVNIAASQSPAAGAITLVSVTGAGITILSAATVVWSSGNTIPSGTLAIDGAPGLVAFGSADLGTGYTMVSVYDPTKAIARNVRIVSGGNDSGITFTVSGYDLYGYAMTETITGANIGTASGIKAFKFITGVTHTGTVAGTITIGTGDVYGLPLRADLWNEIQVYWNSALITAATGFVAAVTTSPATSITGDVRGTYAVQATASDGTRRLVVRGVPSVANVSSNTGLFGVTQA